MTRPSRPISIHPSNWQEAAHCPKVQDADGHMKQPLSKVRPVRPGTSQAGQLAPIAVCRDLHHPLPTT